MCLLWVQIATSYFQHGGEVEQTEVSHLGHILVGEEDVAALGSTVDDRWDAAAVQILQTW